MVALIHWHTGSVEESRAFAHSLAKIGMTPITTAEKKAYSARSRLIREGRPGGATRRRNKSQWRITARLFGRRDPCHLLSSCSCDALREPEQLVVYETRR